MVCTLTKQVENSEAGTRKPTKILVVKANVQPDWSINMHFLYKFYILYSLISDFIYSLTLSTSAPKFVLLLLPVGYN